MVYANHACSRCLINHGIVKDRTFGRPLQVTVRRMLSHRCLSVL